jgi:hypothetical protein
VPSEVKGIWFVALRSYLRERAAAESYGQVLAAIEPAHRAALADPIASAWYPEEALQAAFAAVRAQVAPEPRQFLDLLDSSTEIATSRFFRALLKLASASFVIRQIPSIWTHVRRGAGSVVVDQRGGGTTVLQFRDFPYYYDENYRLLTVAAIRTIIRTSTGKVPRATIIRATDDSLDLRLEHEV